MSFIINSGATTSLTSSYTIVGTGSGLYDSSWGGSGLLYTHRRTTAIRYTTTDKTIMYNNHEFPVFVSDKGRSFIFQVSKTGQEYKKYIK